MIPVKKFHEHSINIYHNHIYPVIQTRSITKFTFPLIFSGSMTFRPNKVFARRWKEIEGNLSQDSRIGIMVYGSVQWNIGNVNYIQFKKLKLNTFKGSFRRVRQIGFQRMGPFALKYSWWYKYRQEHCICSQIKRYWHCIFNIYSTYFYTIRESGNTSVNEWGPRSHGESTFISQPGNTHVTNDNKADFHFDLHVHWSGIHCFMGEFAIGSSDEWFLGVWFVFVDRQLFFSHSTNVQFR